MNKLEIFNELHNREEALLLGNVWDAQSAKIAMEAGFQALGTSSHAIANSLGYEDGEQLSVDELLFVIKRILHTVTIPVSVDFEAGYSDDPNIVAQNVEKLFHMGIVGINLEDGKVINSKRVLQDPQLLAQKINAIKAKCPIFINARIDTYTTQQENPLEKTLERAEIYKVAGADGIFVPLIEQIADIQEFVSKITLPLNVFTTVNLPDYNILSQLGVKRISHGAKQYELLVNKSKDIFEKFSDTKAYAYVLGNEQMIND
jgi:2-methylisocitrate lyase-like PEP mutase family enzyme